MSDPAFTVTPARAKRATKPRPKAAKPAAKPKPAVAEPKAVVVIEPEKRKVGRPTRKTSEVLETLYTVVERGGWLTEAAKAAGIGRRTIYDWLEAGDEDVKAVIEDAKIARRKRLLDAIDKRIEDDWRAAAWELERLHPDEFGKNATLRVEGGATTNQLILNRVELNAGDPDRLASVLARLAEAGALPVGFAAGGAGEGDDAPAD